MRRSSPLLLLLLVFVACGDMVGTAPQAPQTAIPAAAQVVAATTRIPRSITPTPDPDVRRFPETGQAIRGDFRRFWEQRGGLPIFGFPLTAPFFVDGVTVQYFERARFEARDGQQVALGRIGAEGLLAADRPVEAAAPRAGCQFFVETGHNVCEPVLGLWRRSGGLPILGFPLEDLAEHEGVQIQYFERARVERRPDGQLGLGRVGAEALAHSAGGSILRDPARRPSTWRATIIGQSASVRPFEQATVHVRVPGYSGPAEIIVADRRAATGHYPVSIVDGAADIAVEALGELGSQAAIVVIDDAVAGVGSSALALRAETSIQTGQPRFDQMLPMIRHFMAQDTSTYVFDGHRVHGYRSPDSNLLWLRDHVHQSKGFAYWEPDMTSLLDQFRRFQYTDGYFDDYIASYHFGIVRGRMDVEADVEYLFIEGVYRAWQATADDAWMRGQIQAMERALAYIRSHPQRWDTHYQLVKRAFTVDTWDFEYGPPTISPDGKVAPRHWFDANTRWNIFHGDNTGYANSMELLARMYERLGNGERAAYWRHEAAGILERLNKIAWNGRFFRHMVHITPIVVPGVDEEQQLSLSNAYAINRTGVDESQKQAIIAEYHRRYLEHGTHFSEWFSIDPPFPADSLSTAAGWGKQPGEYVNGGLMPLVGGELARGALTHGAETYGFDILQRYYSLIAGAGGSYLWYYPEGQPGISGPDTLATDGWGSSAMLAALIEGAAGITDEATRFELASIAPRWPAAPDVQQADVVVRYGASDGYVAYRWARQTNAITLRWTGSGSEVRLHLMLPPEAGANIRVTVDGVLVSSTVKTSGTSRYVETTGAGRGVLSVQW